MPDCECLPGCPFFNDRMPMDASLAALFKRKFCLGENGQCARHMVFRRLGRDAVPADLYPHEVQRVDEILEAAA